MVSAPSWRDHFKIEDKTVKAFWEEFSESSPLRASELSLATADQSIEFVLWCIREGLFSEEAFTHYQSELSSLPVVRHDFFTAPVDHAFWDRVKDLHPWNAQCLPLTEWDGTILIGSVWPEGTFKPSLRHRLVLGTPSSLRDYFTRFQTKASSSATPLAAIKPPPISIPKPAMAPPKRVAPPKAATPPPTPVAVAPAPAPVAPKIPEAIPVAPVAVAPPIAELSSDDPFAALNRELGLVAEPADDEHHDAPKEGEESEALVIPEGLSFTKEELSRITGIDVNEIDSKVSMKDTREPAMPEGMSPEMSFANDETAEEAQHATPDVVAESGTNASAIVPEGGTLVHNFETGDREVVEKKAVDSTSVDTDVIEPNAPEHAPAVTAEKSAFELSPSEEAGQELSLSDDFDPDKTQPSAIIPPPAPTMPPPLAVAKPASPPTSAPFMPFAPQVTPDRPAMVKPSAPPSPVIPEKPAFAPQGSAEKPSAPVAEATVVVNAEEALTLEAAPKRRPLFEPSASPAAPSGSTPAVPAQSFQMSNTQTGTGTAARSRRLESTPVTSFFGMNGTNPGIQRVNSATKTPGVRHDHTGHVVSVNKIEPLHLDQCSTVDEAGAQAILQACNIYDTAMILLFKDGELQPWKWNDLFLSVKGEKPDSIELKDPSIFKVVFRTAKPYHGYIVTSPVNQKFVNEFYRGMLPKHGSVIPIMIDGRMGGMLLGFTNSKIDYRQSLRLMERLAFDLGRVFKSIRANVSKAS